MIASRRRAIFSVIGLLFVISPLAAEPEAPLRVGFGIADVTPAIEKPVYLAGFGKNRRATRVHDPLKARAVALAHRDQTLVFVSVDVIGLFNDLVERTRPRLPGVSYLLVSSTHNHHGPDTIGMWGPSLFQTGVDPNYLKQVEDGIVAAAQQAQKTLRDVHEVRIGSARDADLLNDSRKPIVKHDELVALQFLDREKRTLGAVVQWNCHPEAVERNNTELTADYVPATVSYLEKKLQGPVVYLTGTVGGLMSPIHVKVHDETGKPLQDGSFAMTERYGVLVGKLAERALSASTPIRLTPLEVRRRELYLPIDNNGYVLGFRLGVLKREAFKWTGEPRRGEPVPVGDKKPRLACKTEIACLKLGELDVAAIPGEIYPELVLGKVVDPPEPGVDFPDAPIEPAIYAQLTGRHRMIVGLANDEIGYILPKRQWDEKPPFAYGLTRAPYGEINSLGPETGPLLCNAFRDLAAGK